MFPKRNKLVFLCLFLASVLSLTLLTNCSSFNKKLSQLDMSSSNYNTKLEPISLLNKEALLNKSDSYVIKDLQKAVEAGFQMYSEITDLQVNNYHLSQDLAASNRKIKWLTAGVTTASILFIAMTVLLFIKR